MPESIPAKTLAVGFFKKYNIALTVLIVLPICFFALPIISYCVGFYSKYLLYLLVVPGGIWLSLRYFIKDKNVKISNFALTALFLVLGYIHFVNTAGFIYGNSGDRYYSIAMGTGMIIYLLVLWFSVLLANNNLVRFVIILLAFTFNPIASDSGIIKIMSMP